MNKVTNPLELLEFIHNILPNAYHLAQDKNGECFIYTYEPILHENTSMWRRKNSIGSYFKISVSITKNLVWIEEHWTKRIITLQLKK